MKSKRGKHIISHKITSTIINRAADTSLHRLKHNLIKNRKRRAAYEITNEQTLWSVTESLGSYLEGL